MRACASRHRRAIVHSLLPDVRAVRTARAAPVPMLAHVSYAKLLVLRILCTRMWWRTARSSDANAGRRVNFFLVSRETGFIRHPSWPLCHLYFCPSCCAYGFSCTRPIPFPSKPIRKTDGNYLSRIKIIQARVFLAWIHLNKSARATGRVQPHRARSLPLRTARRRVASAPPHPCARRTRSRCSLASNAPAPAA